MFTLLGSMLNPPRKVYLITPSEVVPEKTITEPEVVKGEKKSVGLLAKS